MTYVIYKVHDTVFLSLQSKKALTHQVNAFLANYSYTQIKNCDVRYKELMRNRVQSQRFLDYDVPSQDQTFDDQVPDTRTNYCYEPMDAVSDTACLG